MLEEALIRADLGADLARRLAAEIAEGRYDAEISEAEIREHLATAIARVMQPSARPFVVDSARKPFVVLVAGVNGTGKTTTIGKLAAKLSREGQRVTLAAGDTFRAAAIEQLKIWGERAGAQVIARAPGADAAGLAFEALEKAKSDGADVLLIDTAGRLQNKAGLMAELQKIARVLKKLDSERAPCRVARARRNDGTERDLPGGSVSGGSAPDRARHDQAGRHRKRRNSGCACRPI